MATKESFMKLNWRRIGRWSAAISGLGFLSILLAAWLIGGALIAPANRAVGQPPDDFPACAIQIKSESGATLSGWHLPVSRSEATVLLLHPIRSDRRSMLSRAKLFQEHGYSTLLIDLQAHGESTGEKITFGFLEQHDVRAAVDFIRNSDPNQKIAIVGRSLGGASTVYANPDVDAIVLESVYSSVAKAVHNRIEMRIGLLHHVVAPLLLLQLEPRLSVSPNQLRPLDDLQEIDCPILIASGDCDARTKIEETHWLFDAVNEPKKLVVFDGAEHIDLLAYAPQKYENEIVGFVNEHLAIDSALAKNEESKHRN